MRYAFQDDDNCFFVLDLMLGGDLRCRFFLLYSLEMRIQICSLVHLERQKAIAEEVVVFWVAELSLALHYLHQRKIIHRFVSY